MTPRRHALLLQTVLLLPLPAFAESMLMPGWAPIAAQALGDIRAAEQQQHPGASTAPRPESTAEAQAAKAAFDTFIAAKGGVPQSGEAEAGAGELIDSVVQALAGNEAATPNGADRVARAFTLGNAMAQLASGVYGGPPGGAAYASWWAYQQPGATAAQALRVGLLAGVGLWGVRKDTDGTEVPTVVIQRTSLAAALGGLAIAAAGGDEQALREVFFDAGAAVLWQDGSRVYCFSGLVHCQQPPASAAVYQGDRLQGWALGQLEPVSAQAGALPAQTSGRLPTTTPMALHNSGSIPLDSGWTLSWQVPQGIEPGLLYPVVALTRGAAAPPPAASSVPTVASRYLCEQRGATRAIWVVPGDKQAGYVCRTMYQVDKTRAVLWNALQNPDVCEAKARAQVAREQAHGYQCRLAEP